jgi:hypothetical protein
VAARHQQVEVPERSQCRARVEPRGGRPLEHQRAVGAGLRDDRLDHGQLRCQRAGEQAAHGRLVLQAPCLPGRQVEAPFLHRFDRERREAVVADGLAEALGLARRRHRLASDNARQARDLVLVGEGERFAWLQK